MYLPVVSAVYAYSLTCSGFLLIEWIKVLILGIVEGVTEFLPISSTGHLIIAATFLELSPSLRGTFEIFIQIGAVVAVIAYYWSDLWRQATTIHRDRSVQLLWLKIMVAFVPAAGIGFLFIDAIEAVLHDSIPIGLALIVGGVGFIVVERVPVFQQQFASDASASSAKPVTALEDVTLKQAIFIGLWQVLALIPGMSRSGMSILGGLFSGLSRQTATQFSFYLAIPTLGLATVYSLLRDLHNVSAQDMGYLIGGAIVSGVVAWLSIAWLLRYIARNDFVAFGVYRIVVGVLIILLALGGVLG